MIIKYYTSDECIINIIDEDINMLKERDDLNKIIFELLSNEDTIINMIGLTIIIDMKIDYDSIIYIPTYYKNSWILS